MPISAEVTFACDFEGCDESVIVERDCLRFGTQWVSVMDGLPVKWHVEVSKLGNTMEAVVHCKDHVAH